MRRPTKRRILHIVVLFVSLSSLCLSDDSRYHERAIRPSKQRQDTYRAVFYLLSSWSLASLNPVYFQDITPYEITSRQNIFELFELQVLR
jgi:hypothetical protein